jgi:CubicO group peptidase (beta-lactamase class C family)
VVRERIARAGALRCLALGAGFLVAAGASAAPALDEARLARALDRAAGMTRLHALIVARDGATVVERRFRGPGLDVPVNIKSVSKSIIAALVGAAIGRGILRGPDQPIAALLPGQMPDDGDARLATITVGHLLSMRAGLERTSGRNYGRWVASGNWVRFALARPFVDEPGGGMLYSTGNSHLLSAILTRAAGRSTRALAEDWLGAPLGIGIPAWQTDPQGIYFGGNNMVLSPRALLRFGELYRNDGVVDGRRVLPDGWVRDSWTPRAQSRFSGDYYGYGWFITEACGSPLYYARGFGGQFVYIAPAFALTVVITSDATIHTRIGGYRDALRALVAQDLVPAAVRAGRTGTATPDC